MAKRSSGDAIAEYKAWLRERWTPMVAVVASAEAEELCWKRTGMTVTEFLSPFGNVHQLNSGLGGL